MRYMRNFNSKALTIRHLENAKCLFAVAKFSLYSKSQGEELSHRSQCSNVFTLLNRNALRYLVISQRLKRRFYSSQYSAISNLQNNKSEAILHIEWNDGKSCDFPHIFLRDNCQCPQCFHQVVQTRLIYTLTLIDFHISAKDVTIDDSGQNVFITWPDGHLSVFTSDWLKENRFLESESDYEPEYMVGMKRKLWFKEDLKQLPMIQYSDWIEKDEYAMEHIEHLLTYGLCIIKNGPPHPDTGRRISERIGLGYNQLTHYGQTFTVKVKPAPSNLAYTNNYLPLHVDQPYIKHNPDIQYLHCIEQSEGDDVGVNIFSDGFCVAEEMRKSDEELFNLLAKTIIEFHDIGTDELGDFNCVCERPTFQLDWKDEMEAVNFSYFVRSPRIYAPSNKIKEVYRGWYKFAADLISEKHAIKFKLEPGDTVTFDNKRVLHGRTSYDATKTSRWLEGGYVEWDSVLSRYRTLRSKMST